MTKREYQILRWIEENPLISQQELAERAGIARSGIAEYISSLTRKGYILGKGYILRTAPYVAVIGSAGLEVAAQTLSPSIAGTPSRAIVRTRPGGTGRSIACNLRLLGVDVSLITALGGDSAAQELVEDLGRQEVDLTHSLRLSEQPTAISLTLSEPDGSCTYTVCDTAIYDAISPVFLETQLSFLHNAQLIVVDATVPAESIRWLSENCRVPILAAVPSTVTSKALWELLPTLHTVYATAAGIKLLSNIPLTSRHNIGRAADLLLDYGAKRIFFDLGRQGVFAADQVNRHFLPVLPGQYLSDDGCAEAFAAALAWAWVNGMTLESSAQAGLAAASITMESAAAVNPTLSAAEVQRRCARARAKFQYPESK